MFACIYKLVDNKLYVHVQNFSGTDSQIYYDLMPSPSK